MWAPIREKRLPSVLLGGSWQTGQRSSAVSKPEMKPLLARRFVGWLVLADEPNYLRRTIPLSSPAPTFVAGLTAAIIIVRFFSLRAPTDPTSLSSAS